VATGQAGPRLVHPRFLRPDTSGLTAEVGRGRIDITVEKP
jgi:hypothetical protein